MLQPTAATGMSGPGAGELLNLGNADKDLADEFKTLQVRNAKIYRKVYAARPVHCSCP